MKSRSGASGESGAIECSKRIQDTTFCQGNVRRFAHAQFDILRDLETELHPGTSTASGHRALEQRNR